MVRIRAVFRFRCLKILRPLMSQLVALVVRDTQKRFGSVYDLPECGRLMLQRIIAPVWGLAGVLWLLGFAIYRLTPVAVDAIKGGLTAFQWVVLVVWALFMAVAEGYRGFQKKFSPRTAARVRYLRDHPNWLRTLLAPAFCMGYFHSNKKTKIVSICLTVGIFLLVMLVRLIKDDTWRGIIDFGVVLGLTWGVVSLLMYVFLALTKKEFAHSPETP